MNEMACTHSLPIHETIQTHNKVKATNYIVN